MSSELNVKQSKLPGLLVVGLLALISYLIHNLPYMLSMGISSLVIAIVLGMLIGNVGRHPLSWNAGIQFSAKRLLRIAIILYGFRLTFQQIASLGMPALVLDIFMVTTTLILGYVVGHKLLKLDKHMALLISIGSAICGAAAVLAMEDVLKSEPYKAVVAVGTVVLFGTISMFLYPFLQHMDVFGFSSQQFGMFAGASVHEVAQAMVAGADISAQTGDTAVIVKMMRVLLLVPVLFIAAFLMKSSGQEGGQKQKINIPWFAVGFVLVIAFNSLHLLNASQVSLINQLDIILLTMAMGAIGIETKYSKVKHVGLNPLYLAVILFGWLFAAAFAVVSYIG